MVGIDLGVPATTTTVEVSDGGRFSLPTGTFLQRREVFSVETDRLSPRSWLGGGALGVDGAGVGLARHGGSIGVGDDAREGIGVDIALDTGVAIGLEGGVGVGKRSYPTSSKSISRSP